MLTEMRISALPLDQLHLDCSDRNTTVFYQATDERTYVINSHGHLSSIPSHGASALIPRLSRTNTLPEIPASACASLVSPRSPPPRQLKQRSHSFAMSDIKTISRSDPTRKTWDGPLTPRRHSKETIGLKLSANSGSSTVRPLVNHNSDSNGKEKGRARVTSTNNKQNKTHNKAKLKYRDDSTSNGHRHVHKDETTSPEFHSSFESDNSSDDYSESKSKRVGFSPSNSTGDCSESSQITQKMCHMAMSESSEDEQDSSQTTQRKPKSILKKKDLEFSIRKTQGVSFDDNEYRSPRHPPSRQRSMSVPTFSPRPEISFTCSREFAAAMEDLSDHESDGHR